MCTFLEFVFYILSTICSRDFMSKNLFIKHSKRDSYRFLWHIVSIIVSCVLPCVSMGNWKTFIQYATISAYFIGWHNIFFMFLCDMRINEIFMHIGGCQIKGSKIVFFILLTSDQMLFWVVSHWWRNSIIFSFLFDTWSIWLHRLIGSSAL